MAQSKNFSRNLLLSALSAADRARLLPHLKLVPLALKDSLEKPNTRIDRVYFVEEGIACSTAKGLNGGRATPTAYRRRSTIACSAECTNSDHGLRSFAGVRL
jgi:hypothetical protein